MTLRDGAFDPTVQSAWRGLAAGGAPAPAPGMSAVEQTGVTLRLSQPGTQLTLNGIAQGYITDRIAHLLRQHGLQDVLIDIGEIAALGHRPDGGAWRAGIRAPSGRIIARTTLSDRALATSSPMGTGSGLGRAYP